MSIIRKATENQLNADDLWSLNEIQVHGEYKIQGCAVKRGLE
jgi:hypothetical protein